jgi:probable rRNA maturation factor
MDAATNVLSFPAGETGSPAGQPTPLGDIAIAAETVLAEAEQQGIAPRDHALHLVVHGVLHLLGYDHEAKTEANRMERLEVAILARLGVADPYQAPRRRPARGRRRR